MTSKDLIVTPFVLLLVYVVAYILRPKFTDKNNRRYFMPGLTMKIIGALAVGFIYQFYYDGGDTYNFYSDSKLIWKAFQDSPSKAFKLIYLGEGQHFSDTYQYSSQMYFYRDGTSYMIVRIIAILGFFTFQSYASIAILFATFSFIGTWSLFKMFYLLYPELHKKTAFAVLFVPSTFFWGSGVFKDTITFGCLGILTYCLYNLFIIKKRMMINTLLVVISF